MVSPSEDGSSSIVSTTYLAGNRMLVWNVDNPNGQYSPVQNSVYLYINGTQTMQLFDEKEMNISDAAEAQPNYLGSEADGDSLRCRP